MGAREARKFIVVGGFIKDGVTIDGAQRRRYVAPIELIKRHRIQRAQCIGIYADHIDFRKSWPNGSTQHIVVTPETPCLDGKTQNQSLQ